MAVVSAAELGRLSAASLVSRLWNVFFWRICRTLGIGAKLGPEGSST